MEKILIIRFTSLGDVLQCLAVPESYLKKKPASEIHWLVRSDLKFATENHQSITKTWGFAREDGFWGLLKLAVKLRQIGYAVIYDAHNNVRSHIVCWILRSYWLDLFLPRPTGVKRPKLIRRPKNRIKRLLLFKGRINLFPNPFRGQISYIAPLEKLIENPELPSAQRQLFIPDQVFDFVRPKLAYTKQPLICLVPGAAWNKKRWPSKHWADVVGLLPQYKFIALGGPMDPECAYLHQEYPAQVLNLGGQLTLAESCAVIQLSQLVVAADTGLLHAAEQSGVSAIALIGPTAFGYPSRATTRVLEINMPCRPCTKDGRGKCSQEIYRKCLVDIAPERVANAIDEIVRNKLKPTQSSKPT